MPVAGLTVEGAVQIGWSKEKKEGVISVEEDVPELFGATLTVPAENPTEENRTIVIYAVWAVDKDGDGIADYSEKYRIIYNKNIAVVTGYVPVDNDVHVANETVTVKDGGTLSCNGYAFAGWSLKRDPAIIDGEADLEGRLVSELRMTPEQLTGLAEKVVTLYDMWAVDSNGNGTPDFRDEKYRVSYDLNGGRSANVPEEFSNARYTANTAAALWDPTGSKLAKAGAVFIGWSETKYNDNVTATVSDLITNFTVMMKEGGVKVYAVWAADANANGTPTILRPYILSHMTRTAAILPARIYFSNTICPE